MRSGWFTRNFRYGLELLSCQMAQVIPELSGRGIYFRFRALVPVTQPRPQRWQEKMLDGFVYSWRVRTFHQAKHIVCGYQSTDLTQFTGTPNRLRKVAVITLLQLWVGEIHDVSSIQRKSVSKARQGGITSKPGRCPAL